MLTPALPEFQSTHPRGVRPNCDAAFLPQNEFQSTHPRGVRRLASMEVRLTVSMFQSTHPRGVRRQASPKAAPPGRVSIHAPAWGATHRAGPARLGYRVSIHAPAWGATGRPVSRPPIPTSFNPRTRVGCDQFSLGILDTLPVSIHAPAWGATVSMFYPVDSRD